MKKIKINIISKTGSIQKREIKKDNLIFYERKGKYYIKKEKIKISRIKFERKLIKKEKKQVKKIKKVIKVRKEKLISKKIRKGCDYNYKQYYTGQNHNGYVRTHPLDLYIDIDTTDSELRAMIEVLQSNIKDDVNSLRCPQRMSYVRLHYQLQLSNNIDDMRHSSNTTKTSFNFKTLLNRTEDIFLEIVKLVESYISVNIYKQEFVNYEFNSVLQRK